MAFTKIPIVPDYIYSPRNSENDIPYFERSYLEQVRFYGDDVKETELRFEYAKRIGYAWMSTLATRVPEQDQEFKFYGDNGFAWPVDHSLLKNCDSPLFICAGAGTNISFELELATLYPSSDVWLLDPSPQSVQFVNSLDLPSNLHFEPVGMSDKTETLVFHKPSIQGIGSLSVLALNPSEQTFELPVENLESTCKRAGKTPLQIDYLKFDIEGSEHAVIEYLVEKQIFPKQLTFEFDQPVPPWTMEKALRTLVSCGYELRSVWGLNVYMVHKNEGQAT